MSDLTEKKWREKKKTVGEKAGEKKIRKCKKETNHARFTITHTTT